jgi:hypothetical protein
MTTAQTILDTVRPLLIDPSKIRWSDDDLLRYMSDGQRTIAAMVPDAAADLAVVQLSAGTKQLLPSDGSTLMSVTRNMGTDGVTIGAAIRVTRRDLLDNVDANWHTKPSSTVVKHYIYDPRNNKTFYVYPPSPGTNYIEILYARQPQQLVAGTDVLVVTDDFIPPMVNYTLGMAYQMDADASDAGKAQAYMSAFVSFIQARTPAKLDVSPNLAVGPVNLQVPGAAA